MWEQTGRAVLNSVIQIVMIAAAIVCKDIKRTVTEKAIEILRFIRSVAGEIFTLLVLEKGVAVFHRDTPNRKIIIA